MGTLDMIGIILGTVACIIGVFCLPTLFIELIDHIIESYRRNKYPEYYEYYDTAVFESFKIGGELAAEKKRIQHYIKLYGEGYLAGECTADSITKRMAQLTQRWISACDEYSNEKELVDTLWKKADSYAKENNLKWGIIYK